MIWLLLVFFQLKHFIADYLLQNEYMLGKFKEQGWALPLASHCMVHVLFTLVVALIVNPSVALLVCVIDFSLHFIMDRIKASPTLLGRYTALTKKEVMEHKYKIEQIGFMLKKKAITPEQHCIIVEETLANWKAKVKSNKRFWWSLGLDQMVHHLTDILIIYILVVV